MNRETVYSALFTKLQSVVGFNTISRRLKHFADLPENIALPALYQIQGKEMAEQSRGLPTKWRFLIDVYIYCRQADTTASPSSTLNPLIQAVETALAFDPITGTQTLNDTVSHAWITGVEYFEGVQGNVSIAVLNIEILTNK
jgi:hypothetical protein